MNFKGKSVLVVGLARSGVAVARILSQMGAKVIVNDLKDEKQLKEQLAELHPFGVEFYLGSGPDPIIPKADFVIISPSVPIDSSFVKSAMQNGKEVLSEVELAYRLCKAPIVAITGTNGKTTTTALTGEIFKAAGYDTYVVGNIGVPFISKVKEIKEKDVVIAEISSFQLEAVNYFHPKVSAVLNITEDHMNRHKTMDVYIEMKSRIFKNSGASDYIILNADDIHTADLADKAKGNVLFFSRNKTLMNGAWVQDGKIILDIGKGNEVICKASEVRIPGSHNLENALAAALMARVMGINLDIISSVLREFQGVEHRIEYVDTINGVSFYNDSKGTNPDASIKAIKAMKQPTVLIAGGMDKGSSFSSIFDAFGSIITHMVVLGETADKLIKEAKEKGFNDVIKVNSLEEAVNKAYSLSLKNSNVLLSPACASWDMFKDFEERGNIFKQAVKALKEVNG